jgi:hypothetical protein
LIKSLIKVIKDFITQGVTTLPLKRNPILRIMRGGAQENDEGHIDHVEQRILGQLNRGKLFGLPCSLFILCVGDRALG